MLMTMISTVSMSSYLMMMMIVLCLSVAWVMQRHCWVRQCYHLLELELLVVNTLSVMLWDHWVLVVVVVVHTTADLQLR